MPQVGDLMVSSVVTIEPSTSVVDAVKQMIQEEKGPLPIVEGERPVAMVTDRDIVAHVVAEDRDPNSTTVDDIASHELVTVGPDQDVDEARQLMAQHGLDCILVVEGARLAASSPRRISAPTRRLWPDLGQAPIKPAAGATLFPANC